MKIMKKNILFGVVCVALLTATSCSDFLDVQPEGDARDNAYFLNDQQAIDAVDGLYERFHQEAMYGRELFWEQGAANDIVWGKTRDFPTLATFKYTGDESPLRTVFETMYKVISRSNWVIDQLVRQFGIKKCPKKLVISLLFCNFIVDNQLITNIYSDDYH